MSIIACTAIGFEDSAILNAVELCNQLKGVAEFIDGNGCYYQKYKDPSGAALWFCIEKNILVDLAFHFHGQSRKIVCVSHCLKGYRSAESHLLIGSAEPLEDNNPDSGEYSFSFEPIGFLTRTILQYPMTFETQISGYAKEVSFFDDEEGFATATGNPYQENCFVTGFSYPWGQMRDFPLPEAVLIGKVLFFEEKLNELTGKKFLWVHAGTKGGDFDLLVDMRIVRQMPKIGGNFAGDFYLTGELLKPSKFVEFK